MTRMTLMTALTIIMTALAGVLGLMGYGLVRVLRDVTLLLGWISQDLTEGLD